MWKKRPQLAFLHCMSYLARLLIEDKHLNHGSKYKRGQHLLLFTFPCSLEHAINCLVDFFFAPLHCTHNLNQRHFSAQVLKCKASLRHSMLRTQKSLIFFLKESPLWWLTLLFLTTSCIITKGGNHVMLMITIVSRYSDSAMIHISHLSNPKIQNTPGIMCFFYYAVVSVAQNLSHNLVPHTLTPPCPFVSSFQCKTAINWHKTELSVSRTFLEFKYFIEICKFTEDTAQQIMKLWLWVFTLAGESV